MPEIPSDKLPEGYDPWEHLQSQYSAEFNRQVKRYFSDHGNDWQPNLATKRSSMHTACLMQDTDNYAMMALRMSFFFDLLGQSKNGLMMFYGSKENQEPPVEGHPKIVFYFSQDSASVPPSEDHKGDAEYSVRLMQLENTSTNLKSKLLEIANEIKVQFLDANKGIVLTKGNLGVIYKDPIHGFSNGRRILANTEADAIDIYRRICKVIDVPFDEEKITVSNPKKSSTTGNVTQTQIIMGKTRKKRAYRRVMNVIFRYAYALIPGEPQPVFLVDTTYRYHPLVKI